MFMSVMAGKPTGFEACGKNLAGLLALMRKVNS